MGGGTKSILVYHVIPNKFGHVVCDAKTLPANVPDQVENHHLKNPKTFLFFQRKKKQKNLTSATSASGGLTLVPAFENSQGAGSIFLKKPLKKICTFKPLQTFILSDICLVPKAVFSNQKNLLVFRCKILSDKTTK